MNNDKPEIINWQQSTGDSLAQKAFYCPTAGGLTAGYALYLKDKQKGGKR